MVWVEIGQYHKKHRLSLQAKVVLSFSVILWLGGAALILSLIHILNREQMLKQVLDGAKREYDFILLDCTPSLGMLTVNALAAADTTLIPVQAQYLSAKGREQLLQLSLIHI